MVPARESRARFLREQEPAVGRTATIRGFFQVWSRVDGPRRAVTAKWQRNRESYTRTHVVPVLGAVRLDELTAKHLVDLQTSSLERGSPRGRSTELFTAGCEACRDAELAGYRACDLARLFDSRFVTRLDKGLTRPRSTPIPMRSGSGSSLGFCGNATSTTRRPSEAIALRWRDVDRQHRRIRIRRSRVLGEDGRTKTQQA
jgi:hypothetical protein